MGLTPPGKRPEPLKVIAMAVALAAAAAAGAGLGLAWQAFSGEDAVVAEQ